MNTNERTAPAHLVTERRSVPEVADQPAKRGRAKEPLNKVEFTYRLHLWMIGIAAGLVAASMLAHFFQPQDRLWERLIDVGLAFLFGKATNRIGQSFLPPKPGATEDEETR